MSGESRQGQAMDLEADVEAIRQGVTALRRDFAELERRVRKLEVREELLESPSAAGDAPVRETEF